MRDVLAYARPGNRSRRENPGYEHAARFIRQPHDPPESRLCLFCNQREGMPPQYVMCTVCDAETSTAFEKVDRQIAEKAATQEAPDDDTE